MMKKAFYLSFILALLVLLVYPSGEARAQSSFNLTWTSEIVYFNTSGDTGNMTVTFYDGAASYSSNPIAVDPHQSGSLLIGSVSTVPVGFAGSAVISSDVPVAATYLQFGYTDRNKYSEMIYNSFKANQAGTTFYVPTVLRRAFLGNFVSTVGVQNIDGSQNIANLLFYRVDETVPTLTQTVTITAQASYVFTMSNPALASLGNGFSGSLKITSTGNIIAASEETQESGRSAYAFEGVSGGASIVYVPTMLCNWVGDNGTFTSYYAIQAIGGGATVNFQHLDRDTGATLGTETGVNIADGAKVSKNPCEQGVPNDSIGSSVIQATSGQIVVIVKVVAVGPGACGNASCQSGTRTAYLGESSGARNVALPLVRWNTDPAAGFRSFIAVMNIGGAPATDIVATYYNPNGTVAGTPHILASVANPLAHLQKANTWTTIAGGPGIVGDFVGAVIITSDQNVLVTVRNQKNVTGIEVIQFGEDYVGIPFTP
ncbi:MAG: hypothetical protein AB1345_00025 [Chloroflexota bacterium]